MTQSTSSTSGTKEPHVGKELGSVHFSVTESIVNDYYSGLDLPRPTPGGGTICVPSMVASGPDNAYFGQSSFSNHFGHLWMRQEWELFEPLVLGRLTRRHVRTFFIETWQSVVLDVATHVYTFVHMFFICFRFRQT